MFNTIYTLTIIKPDNTHQTITLTNDDECEKVEGGIQLTFGSAPSTTTFFPYHRIWEMQSYDPDKGKNKRSVDTSDDFDF